jgi:hypothetical protein
MRKRLQEGNPKIFPDSGFLAENRGRYAKGMALLLPLPALWLDPLSAAQVVAVGLGVALAVWVLTRGTGAV